MLPCANILQDQYSPHASPMAVKHTLKSDKISPKHPIVHSISNSTILFSSTQTQLTNMARSVISALLLIVLPLALISGAIFRYSVISFIYAFLLLALPWLGPISERNIRTRFRLFVLIIGLISLLTVLAQIIFQSVLLAKKSLTEELNVNCTELRQTLRYFGLESLESANAVRILRLIFPDIIILAVSIICFVIIRRTIINPRRRDETDENLPPATISATINNKTTKLKSIWPRVLSLLRRIRLFLQFIIVGLAAFMYPSIINSIYFLFFLALAFVWSFSIKFGRRYALARAVLVIYTGIHLLIFYLYQFGFYPEGLAPGSIWANVTGLTAIVTTNCTDREPYFARNLAWTDYVNPCTLLLLYFYFAFETNRTLFKRVRTDETVVQSLEQQSLVQNSEGRDANEPITMSYERENSEQRRAGRWMSIIFPIIRVLQRQSYLLALIAMLAWSITFHSLLTLVYLLWACLLWVLPNSRVWCLRMSPFFTIYGAGLLILQYLSGFKIAFNDMNFTVSNKTMKQIGIRIDDFQPAMNSLLIKSFYMMIFWLTLRQYINGKRTTNAEPGEAIELSQIVRRLSISTDAYPRRIGRWLSSFMTKYWIFLSCGMLLLVSIQNKVVVYRIIYMVFYLFFILSFQISFGFWRKTVATFHLTIIIYSMFVLIAIYIYQFPYVCEFLSEKHVSEDLLRSLGLDYVEPDVLALQLLTPSTFLVVNILQLYYFHSDWMDLITMPSDKNIEGPAYATLKEIHAFAKQNTTNPVDTQETSTEEPVTWQQSLNKIYLRINRIYKYMMYYTWRFSEIHIYKLILFLMVILSVYKVCAFNVTLMILATIGLTVFSFRKFINLITLITTGFYILMSMCYQLPIASEQIIGQHIFIHNCSENATLIPNDTAKWFGLEIHRNIDRYIGLYILLTIVLTFEAITRYRQRHRCLSLSVRFNVHLIENRFPILFEPIVLKNVNDDIDEYDIVNYQQADQGVKDFLKYLANFIFYRFGLETCYITTVIVIGVRLDIIAVFYSIWLGLFLVCSRRTIQRIWPFYMLFLTIVFPLQYMIVVGAPPFLCFEYPWTTVDVAGWDQLRRWLFLPDYHQPPSAKQLIADFFQFLFVCQQWRVFKYETKEKFRSFIDASGSNNELEYDNDSYKNNPTWDFVINKRHWLDRLKYAIFMYGAWFVLSIVYLAGITRISLLGLGYLIACFYFFWYGQDFLTKQVTVMLRLWGYLVYYCFSVIFVKACLQVVICIFLYPLSTCEEPKSDSTFCTFVDLLVPCLKADFIPPRNCPATPSTVTEPCDRNDVNASLFMDGFCLFVLLLQKRIFGSYYWEHIVVELRSQAKLASQGAVLFNEIARVRIEEDRAREEETVTKITRSLIRIKEQQSKLHQTDGHAIAAFVETSEHFEAIRSGDYYMFEDESDHEEDEGKQDEATLAQEQILQVLTSSDKEVAAAVAAQKTPSSPNPRISNQELPGTPPVEIEPLPATTTMVTSISESVEPKEQSEEEEGEKKKKKKSGKSVLMKMRLIGQIVVEYFIDLFNRNSRDYREVSKELADMKSRDKIAQQEERIRSQTILATASVVDLDTVGRPNSLAEPPRTRALSQSIDPRQRSRFYRFFDSLFYFAMSRSEFLCYSAMVINHLTSGTLLSMPLPLSIFLWAMLSSRPSRNYWITVITYTEAMIVIKYIFQFQFFPWTDNPLDDDPLKPVNIIGINRKENGASFADLILLLSLFLHRSILKQLGLWKEETPTPPEDETQVVPSNDNDEETPRPDPRKIRSSTNFIKPIIDFYRQLQQALFVHDVYASTFFCDFINMCLILGFYSQFGFKRYHTERAGGNVVETIKENKVPVAFLVILLIQFILIIIDRALYLRRNVRGKLFFQLFQVIAVHVWLFFVLPAITHIKFRDNVAAQFWYLFKCIYFGYSSVQVRLGYPKRIAGNFLMKRFNYVNQVLYRIYLLIPFLLELRTIMDWIFTDTALGLSSWLQLEDIYSDVYLLKCARWAEKKYPTTRGVPRPKITKYGVGGTLLAVIILLIWFPLLFFSFSSSFYIPNPPKEATVEIKLGGYLPIYHMTAQDFDLREFSNADLKNLRDKIDSFETRQAPAKDAANAFLRDFNPNDILCVNFFATSVDLWQISQPIRDIVIGNLNSTNDVPVRFSYTITRNPLNDDNTGDTATVVTGEHTVNITKDEKQTRATLIQLLQGEMGDPRNTNFTIQQLLPRYLHVKAKSKPEEIDVFQKVFPNDYYANITMGLNRTIPNSTEVWWEMYEVNNSFDYKPSKNCSFSGENYLTMMFFNDKISPANISFLTRYGIIGLYTTFVIVVARLLRTILQISKTIMFNELPNVERLWHLLRDIYLVREHSIPKHKSQFQSDVNPSSVSLRTEEQLFAKLLFLYRSPETLIRFTKPKSE